MIRQNGAPKFSNTTKNRTLSSIDKNRLSNKHGELAKSPLNDAR